MRETIRERSSTLDFEGKSLCKPSVFALDLISIERDIMAFRISILFFYFLPALASLPFNSLYRNISLSVGDVGVVGTPVFQTLQTRIVAFDLRQACFQLLHLHILTDACMQVAG